MGAFSLIVVINLLNRFEMLLDRRRCILTLVILTFSTVFVIYRFGKLTKIDLFKGHDKKGDLIPGLSGDQCMGQQSTSCSKCSSKQSTELTEECSLTGFIRIHSCRYNNGTENHEIESCVLSSDER